MVNLYASGDYDISDGRISLKSIKIISVELFFVEI